MTIANTIPGQILLAEKVNEIIAELTTIAAHAALTNNPHAVTAAQVGLGNVENTSDLSKPISTLVQTALNLKAALDSPAFTGIPTAPTAALNTNTTQLATMAAVKAAADAVITQLTTGAPGILDTLDELAAALGDDANYAANVATALALKAPLASPALTGNPTAPTQTAGDNTTKLATTAFVAAAVATGGATIASQAEAEAGTDNTKTMTALRTVQAIAKWGHAPDVMVRDEKTSTTDGGIATSGAWLTRDLNTVVRNVLTGASLASNQVTLPAGTYYAQASAPFYATDRSAIKLRNVTDATDIALGSTEFMNNGTLVGGRCHVSGFFTLAAPKAISVQYRVFTTTGGNGLGVQTTFATNIYAMLDIWKVA